MFDTTIQTFKGISFVYLFSSYFSFGADSLEHWDISDMEQAMSWNENLNIEYKLSKK